MDEKKIETIDEYILQFSQEIQDKLNALRETIKEAAPEAEEKISWQMPTFILYRNLVHFAAHKNHIGFYPGPEALEVFGSRIADYKSSKGAVQFPLNKPLPLDLVREIVKFRVSQNVKLEESKKQRKK